MGPTVIERDCVIAGGGPAGMVLGYLLARAGLRVSVLEKHADFLRDFRGDTIHPSTVRLLRELGLGEAFLELPLSRVGSLDASIDGVRFTVADFTTLPEPDDFLVFAPQWDFLNFLAAEGAKLDGFDLHLSTAAEDLLVAHGRVAGVLARTGDELLEIRARLTVAADGRSSVLRRRAGLRPIEFGAPLDVLWFHLPKPQAAPPPTLAYVSRNGVLLTLDRGTYYQAGIIIPKGSFDQLQQAGLPAFRARIAGSASHVVEAAESIQSWDQVKLLSVQLNRLDTWHRPGFIAIGDAAHAMSPMFGVGVNYAIQDAVALANAIHAPLARGEAPDDVLATVQERRQRPVKKMQRLQRISHRGVIRAATAKGARAVPRPVTWLLHRFSPRIRRFMAQFIGFGYLPERSAIR